MSAWQQTLEAARRIQKPTRSGTIILLGELGSGKSTLIQKLQLLANPSAPELSDTKGVALLDCFSLPQKLISTDQDMNDVDGSGIFVTQKPEHKDFLTPWLHSRWQRHGLFHTAAVITVSLADLASAYQGVSKWLQLLADYLPNCVEKINRSTDQPFLQEYSDLRNKCEACTDIFHYRADADVIYDASVDELPILNIGFPIIVVGSKSDKLPSSGFHPSPELAVEENIFICYMRHLCRQCEKIAVEATILSDGASLIFVNDNPDNANLKNLYRLIQSLFSGQLPKLISVMTPAASLFIPQGSDNLTQIKERAGELGLTDLRLPLSVHIGSRKKTATAAPNVNGYQDVPVPPPMTKFLAQVAETMSDSVVDELELMKSPAKSKSTAAKSVVVDDTPKTTHRVTMDPQKPHIEKQLEFKTENTHDVYVESAKVGEAQIRTRDQEFAPSESVGAKISSERRVVTTSDASVTQQDSETVKDEGGSFGDDGTAEEIRRRQSRKSTSGSEKKGLKNFLMDEIKKPSLRK